MKPRYLLAILSGLLIGTSYIPFPPWAIFFCFIPLWSAWLGEQTYKNVFWTGWITQFVLTLIGFNWVSYTVHEFGHLPWPLAILVLLLFCAFANLHVPLSGVAWVFMSKRLKLSLGAQVVALPVALSIGERVFPMIFDWHFGYTWLYAGFPAFHLADIIGFIGLSNIGAAFNALLLWAWLKRKEGQSEWKFWATSVPLLFLVLNVWGFIHSRTTPVPDAMARFLIVQANVGNQEKLMAEKGSLYRKAVIDRFVNLTRQGIESNPGAKVDYAVWPETAFPDVIEDRLLNFGYPRTLKDAVVSMGGVKLITGGYGRHENGRITNSFFVLDTAGEWAAPPYHKTVLLAFGEYFPGKDLLPQGWVDKYFPEIGEFGRGPGPTVLDTGEGMKIGAQICYEGLFDWFTRQLALKDAKLIVNLTNDSWYDRVMQPRQHMYMTLARAIEVRRPLVRSTNTGISTVILANGKILERSPLHQEWFYLYEVPYATTNPATLFMGWGYWLVPLLLGLTLVIIAVKGRRGRTNAKS